MPNIELDQLGRQSSLSKRMRLQICESWIAEEAENLFWEIGGKQLLAG